MKTTAKYCHRVLILLIFSLSATQQIYAQFDAQLTQYVYNKTIINPAAVGEQQMMQIFGLQRLQWISIDNAPKTTYFSAHTPFEVKQTRHAAGIQFVNDIFGIFVNQQINLQYAYKQKLGDGYLSIGANIGISNVKFKGDSVHFVSTDYFDGNDDPTVPKSEVSGVGFDCGLGLYYSTKNWYVGMAAMHLPEATIHLGDVGEFYMQRLYTVNGGYDFHLTKHPEYTIKTAALVITDFVSWNPSITVLLDYKDKFYGGLGGRLDAISFLLGVKVLNGFSIGYSYDLPINKIITASHGSHELFLAYEFNLALNKKHNKHKSVRIL